MDPKTAAQDALIDAATSCPIGVYAHRGGGEYVVFNHSVDEATLVPLVHYISLAKGTRWTRTIANFTEEIGGRPRFWRVRDATSLQLHFARSAVR